MRPPTPRNGKVSPISWNCSSA